MDLFHFLFLYPTRLQAAMQASDSAPLLNSVLFYQDNAQQQ